MSGPSGLVVGTNALLGAVAGFLTRPCCIGPAALSVMGVSSAGLGEVVGAYRPIFLSFGMLMPVVSIWITFRRDGGWFNKCLAACATVTAFAWSTGRLGW